MPLRALRRRERWRRVLRETLTERVLRPVVEARVSVNPRAVLALTQPVRLHPRAPVPVERARRDIAVAREPATYTFPHAPVCTPEG